MSEHPGYDAARWRYGAPGAGDRRPRVFDRARLRPTVALAGVIAAVVLGGLVLDGLVAAPTAGTQLIGSNVTITPASGWVLVSSAGRPGGPGGPGPRATAAPTAPTASTTSGNGANSQGVVLQKGDATLTAQVTAAGFSGSSAEVMAEVRRELGTQVAQISYGDEHHSTISGNDATSVLFEAVVSGQAARNQSGTLDGEIISMVVAGNAVVVEVAAPQGDLGYVTDDITAMVKTVRTTG